MLSRDSAGGARPHGCGATGRRSASGLARDRGGTENFHRLGKRKKEAAAGIHQNGVGPRQPTVKKAQNNFRG